MKIEVQTLEYTELHRAMSLPGIYAWYAKPSISEVDINPADDFRSLINIMNGYMTSHHPPILDVRIESSFYHRWSQSIDENSHKEWKERLIREIKVLHELGFFNNKDAGKLIVELFKSTIPNIASPLYIGSSGNLNRRLDEHKKELDEVFRLTRGDVRGLDIDELNSFAKRAIYRRFRPANLMVWAVSIDSDFDEINMRALCYFVEWILNGCHAPKLGER